MRYLCTVPPDVCQSDHEVITDFLISEFDHIIIIMNFKSKLVVQRDLNEF